MTVNKHKHEISLLSESLKEKGLKIVDVSGYISREFKTPVFHLEYITLSDGTRVPVEGEHRITRDTPTPSERGRE